MAPCVPTPGMGHPWFRVEMVAGTDLLVMPWISQCSVSLSSVMAQLNNNLEQLKVDLESDTGQFILTTVLKEVWFY